MHAIIGHHTPREGQPALRRCGAEVHHDRPVFDAVINLMDAVCRENEHCSAEGHDGLQSVHGTGGELIKLVQHDILVVAKRYRLGGASQAFDKRGVILGSIDAFIPVPARWPAEGRLDQVWQHRRQCRLARARRAIEQDRAHIGVGECRVAVDDVGDLALIEFIAEDDVGERLWCVVEGSLGHVALSVGVLLESCGRGGHIVASPSVLIC